MKGGESIEVYAMTEHIPMLVRLPLKISVFSFVGYLKGRSSTIIHEKHSNWKYKYEKKRSF